VGRVKYWAEELSRRLRPFLVFRNLLHRSQLAGAGRRYREMGLRKPWFGLVRHADVTGRAEGAARLDRPEGLEELHRLDAYSRLPEALRRGLDEWPEKGYLVAEGLISPETVRRLNADVDALRGAGSIRSHHRAERFMNAHRKSSAAQEIVSDPALTGVLELILGRPAELFQTISFVRGSQQKAHSDAFHMMTEPAGFLVGVWVALEEIDEDSGPVFYLPGSHRLPYVMSEDLALESPPPLLIADKGPAYVERMREMAERSGAEPVHFTAKPGDVLFWHHNLMHGGSAIRREGSTRRSLVAHFIARDVLCYHEVTERPALIEA
jgi:ectoine hydroxylase